MKFKFNLIDKEAMDYKCVIEYEGRDYHVFFNTFETTMINVLCDAKRIEWRAALETVDALLEDGGVYEIDARLMADDLQWIADDDRMMEGR